MSRHWLVLVVLFVAFGIAGSIDYEVARASCDARQYITDKGKRV